MFIMCVFIRLFILIQGNVEQWLLALLNAAQGALHAVIRMASVAIKDPVFKLLEFMDTFPAQVKSCYSMKY